MLQNAHEKSHDGFIKVKIQTFRFKLEAVDFDIY